MSVKKWVELDIQGSLLKDDGTDLTLGEFLEAIESRGILFGGSTKPVTYVDDNNIIYEEEEWLSK